MHSRTLTLACNNRCVFCAQRALDSAIHAAPGPTGERFAFQGGEPTVLPDLSSLIAAARASGAREVLVQTNGRRLAYATYLRELVEAGLTHLDVSLHGPEPAIHDYHTQIEGSFKQTVRGVLNTQSTDVQVAVTTVVTRSNFRHLGAMARLVRKLNVPAWHLAAARPLGAAADDRSAIPPRLGMLPDHLASAIRESHGVELAFSGIPPCVVPSASAVRFLLADQRGHAHVGPCASCAVAQECPGPARGTDDVAAVTDLRPLSSPSALREPAAWFGGLGVVRTEAE
jgi:pyruvate-formate lyase-activating enzyme